MTILCLTMGKERHVQAEACFKEAISLGLKDIDILEEIGDLYVLSGELVKKDLSILAFTNLTTFDPNHGEGW